jgi:hypothetical protein
VIEYLDRYPGLEALTRMWMAISEEDARRETAALEAEWQRIRPQDEPGWIKREDHR